MLISRIRPQSCCTRTGNYNIRVYFTSMKLVAVLILLCGCTHTQLAVSQSALVAQSMNSSVMLVVASSSNVDGLILGSGSATVVRWGGVPCVLTAWHIVEKVKSRSLVLTGNGHTQVVGPFEQVGDRDLAWVAIDVPPNWSMLEASSNCVDHGSCTAWGFPESEDKLISSRATDSGFITLNHITYKMFSGRASAGMSGGPIVDDDNRVIGIVSRTDLPWRPVFYVSSMCDLAPTIQTLVR